MMAKRKIPSIILISIFILLALDPPCVTATHYVVAPAGNPDQITAPPIDPVSITFWGLSPREMAVFLALMVSPVLIFPVELLFALKVFAVLGYRKVEQTAILHNHNRRLIYETIKANPGLPLNALSRMTLIKPGPLKYHLSVLKLKRKILTFGMGRSYRYFENCGKYTEFEKLLIKHLTEKTTNKILERLWSASPLTQQEIVGEIGISAPSVSWHMGILESEKIVTQQKSGRSVSYELSENARMSLQKYYGNK